jgi:hypothetical protein
MTGRARISSEQLRGLMMHGEHLIEHIDERSQRLGHLGGAAVNVLLGICLGMLAAYALHFRWPMVEFEIVGPLMGGAGGALARLLSKDFKGQKRQEKLRLDKLESASRLQMASQIVEFLRSQGRQLPPDVKDGAWAEVHRLVSNQKIGKSSPSTLLLGSLTPAPREKVDS